MTMQLLLWQLLDSAFPTGGFAHSGGLEATHAHGAASSAFDALVHEAILSAASLSLPFVRAAHADGAKLASIDQRLDARTASPVTRRASRTQGRAMLDTSTRIWPDRDLARIADQVRAPHVPIAHGAICRAMGIDRASTELGFLHITMRSLLSASVRLGVVGPHQAQRLQSEAAPFVLNALRAHESFDTESAAQTSPAFELFAATHERLYARLFQS